MGGEAKIFKKSSPNGQLCIYLGNRDFAQIDGVIEPIQGIVVVKDRQKVNVQLVVTFRHGLEEEEDRGVSLKKELIIDRAMVLPGEGVHEGSKLQRMLIEKLGGEATPFTLHFPDLAPNSVLICANKNEDPIKRPMGVSFEVRAHILESLEDAPKPRGSTVSLGIRKTQSIVSCLRQNSIFSTAEKGFVFGQGKIVMEASLSKEVFHHGEEIPVHININNKSKKPVKSISCTINQNCELSIININYACEIARLETRDACPVPAGSNLNKTVILKPMAHVTKGIRGLCLDVPSKSSKKGFNLASSSLRVGDNVDLLGVNVTYSVKVKLMLGTKGGEVETDLPFKLVQPKPDTKEMENLKKEKENRLVVRKKKTRNEGTGKAVTKTVAHERNVERMDGNVSGYSPSGLYTMMLLIFLTVLSHVTWYFTKQVQTDQRVFRISSGQSLVCSTLLVIYSVIASKLF